MQAAYLLFDVLVLAGPIVLASLPGRTRWDQQRLGWLALLVGGMPWLAWDLWVAGDHWDFNPSFVMGPTLLGLPVEEWSFFLVVPFACLYCWERVAFGPLGEKDPRLASAVRAGALLPFLAVAVALCGAPPYTCLALGSAGMPFVLDLLSGVRLFHNPRAWAWLALVAVLTVLFNNVLTGLPIVVYDPTDQLDIRLFTMPVEDLGFGLGHLGVVLLAYEMLQSGETRGELASASA